MMRRISSLRRDDDGVALILVIGLSSVLAALMVAAVAVSLGSLRAARNTQDWNGALAAAYAGIEEYQSRLANDTGYFAFGNPASTFSNPAAAVPAPVTLPTGASTNPAFGLGTAGTWAPVAGTWAQHAPAQRPMGAAPRGTRRRRRHGSATLVMQCRHPPTRSVPSSAARSGRPSCRHNRTGAGDRCPMPRTWSSSAVAWPGARPHGAARSSGRGWC